MGGGAKPTERAVGADEAGASVKEKNSGAINAARVESQNRPGIHNCVLSAINPTTLPR
jgi:hypothetical protein